MYREFVLSEFLEAKESGFHITNPDFDEIEREMLKEERALAEALSEYGCTWEVPQEELSQEELNKRNRERLLTDPFCRENIEGVFLNKDSILVKFTNPGYGVRWTRFSIEELQDLSLELQEKLFLKNSYIFSYLDSSIVQVEEVRFFKSSRKEEVFVKFILNNSIEVVYSLEDNKEFLSFIKEKFDLKEEVEEAWREFKDFLSKVSEVKRAVSKAQRIHKKESGISDWYQYSIKFNEKIIYVFKPRQSRSGEVFYSIFKVEKGDPIMGISDKVESLFAISTDKFLKEWEHLLERK